MAKADAEMVTVKGKQTTIKTLRFGMIRKLTNN
jgi:hypothetical protein